jgi:hypothetical protein
MPANVITGAKAKVRINGIVVGYATGINITEATLNGRVESLGYIDSREITPISRTVTGSCSLIRIFNSSISGIGANQDIKGYSDVPGGEFVTTDDNGFVNTEFHSEVATSPETKTLKDRTANVLNKAPFVLEIVDSATGTASSTSPNIIYSVHGCRISSQNIVVDRGSLMGVQVTFDAEYLVRYEGEDSANL